MPARRRSLHMGRRQPPAVVRPASLTGSAGSVPLVAPDSTARVDDDGRAGAALPTPLFAETTSAVLRPWLG